MKLAKVEHERCNEWSGSTYVWIPDEWTEDDFDRAVDEAADKYLKFVEAWKDAPAPNKATSYSKPDYEAHPDKTVAEVDAIHEKEKEVYAAWWAEQQQSKRSFGQYLEAEGCKPFWDDCGVAFTTMIYWGHRHGWPIDYEDTNANAADLKGPGDKPLKPLKRIVRKGKL